MSRLNRLLINNVNDCVDEMLEGIVKQNPGQCLLEGHRVIIREDLKSFLASQKVSIICGGGSGHEPFAAGFVGQGMLTAAVAGSVFTSPPVNDILAAIEAVASPAGTLLIVANYTGDRLNFGIALERARSFGINVEMVVVGEDCAVESQDKTAGKRGLVGIMAIMKIAGALSENGNSLDYMVKVTTAAASKMATIGISLTGCSIPGGGSSFTLDPSEMELGLGVHGEAGVKRMKLLPANETVKVMLDHMTTTHKDSQFVLENGKEISLIMNNLGGLAMIEMHIVTRKAIEYLENKGLQVQRVYVGHFMTSLDMSGFNLNVLILDDKLSACLDAETTAPAWPRANKSFETGFQRNSKQIRKITSKMQNVTEPGATTEMRVGHSNSSILSVIKQACNGLIQNEQYLNELDTSAGDGDCGTTLKRGANHILSHLENWHVFSVSDILSKMAVAAETSMGGASGALYSLFFTSCARHANDLSTSSMAACVKAGIDSVSKYGGAEPGDRTMLDALVAVHTSLTNSVNKNHSLVDSIKHAAVSAEKAAIATTSMKAKAGRASYVSAKLLTQPDPGAVAVSIWMKAISSWFNTD